MRRHPLALVALALSPLVLGTLAGCASWNDRNGFVRTDPVIWFLGGAPTETNLDWPRREVPTLRPLISSDYISAPTPRPLDYPRGWSADNPPYAPAGDAAPGPMPDVDDSRCPGTCDSAPASALRARGGDASGVRRSRGD